MAMTCSYRSLNGRHLNIWMWWLIGMAPGHLGQMSPVRPDIIQNDPVRCCRITVYYFKIPAWRGKLCWLDRSMDYWWKCLYIHGQWLDSHYGAVNDICTVYSVQCTYIYWTYYIYWQADGNSFTICLSMKTTHNCLLITL